MNTRGVGVPTLEAIIRLYIIWKLYYYPPRIVAWGTIFGRKLTKRPPPAPTYEVKLFPHTLLFRYMAQHRHPTTARAPPHSPNRQPPQNPQPRSQPPKKTQTRYTRGVTTENKTLLLIDGHSLALRSFFGIYTMAEKTGQHIFVRSDGQHTEAVHALPLHPAEHHQRQPAQPHSP